MRNKVDLGSILANLSISDIFEDYLYHYTTTKIAIESILPNRTLKFTSLKSSNDPLEALHIFYIISGDDIQSKIGTKFSCELNRRLKSGYKIISFCIDSKLGKDEEPPFNRGYGKARMWNQYGDNHAGVCLVFSKLKLLKAIQKTINSNENSNEFELFHGKIRYINNLNQFRKMTSLDSSDTTLNDEKLFNTKLKEHLRLYLFRKLRDYDGEKEYRIALYNNLFEKKKEILIDFNDALQGIIFGSNLNHVYQQIFEKYKETMKFELFSMSWNYSDFKLEQISS